MAFNPSIYSLCDAFQTLPRKLPLTSKPFSTSNHHLRPFPINPRPYQLNPPSPSFSNPSTRPKSAQPLPASPISAISCSLPSWPSSACSASVSSPVPPSIFISSASPPSKRPKPTSTTHWAAWPSSISSPSPPPCSSFPSSGTRDSSPACNGTPRQPCAASGPSWPPPAPVSSSPWSTNCSSPAPKTPPSKSS